MIGRLSDDAVRAAVAPTLRGVHADPGSEWSRQAVAQLIAIVEHVERRGPDRTDERRAALTAALDALAGNPLVPASGSAEQRASDALVAAIDDSSDADAASAVRAALRPLLVAELDEELAATTELMDGFRGRVRDA